MFKPSPIKDLERLAAIVQKKVNELFEACEWSPAPESALDQCGLKDGKEIIKDYIKHGEAGVAFEHLDYMIKETKIRLNKTDLEAFERLHELYEN